MIEEKNERNDEEGRNDKIHNRGKKQRSDNQNGGMLRQGRRVHEDVQYKNITH